MYVKSSVLNSCIVGLGYVSYGLCLSAFDLVSLRSL